MTWDGWLLCAGIVVASVMFGWTVPNALDGIAEAANAYRLARDEQRRRRQRGGR